MTTTSDEGEFHYVIAVRCKRLEIPDMVVRGKWMIMHLGQDFVETKRRWRIAENYIRPLEGEMVVFKIDATNIGKVWVIGLSGTRQAPPLDAVIRTDEDTKAAFWRRAGVQAGIVPKRVPASPRHRGWKDWFAPA